MSWSTSASDGAATFVLSINLRCQAYFPPISSLCIVTILIDIRQTPLCCNLGGASNCSGWTTTSDLAG